MQALDVETELFVDARCLQDPAFSRREIGSCAEMLLRGGLLIPQVRKSYLFVGLVDRNLPPLAASHATLFDEVRYAPNERAGRATILLSLSPMTYDPFFAARLQDREHRQSIALVYDFIPFDVPNKYLGNVAERISYYARLARLNHYDAFFAISEYTKRRLQSITGVVGPIQVTGIPLRNSFAMSTANSNEKAISILAACGDDWRKNPEVVVRAHAKSIAIQHSKIPLKFAGLHDIKSRELLKQLSTSLGGDPKLLEFVGFLSEFSLAEYYRSSTVVVVPSRIEGFSIPVIEACAVGVAVVASDCEAHRELLPNDKDRFAADDDVHLSRLLEEEIFNRSAHQKRLSRQAEVSKQFRSDLVNDRFWSSIVATCAKRSAPLIASTKSFEADEALNRFCHANAAG